MPNLIQTNIVNIFSIVDLQILEKTLSELFPTSQNDIDNIESAKAPNLIGFFNHKEKMAVLITANSLRVDNNNRDENSNFIDEFFRVYKPIKKIADPQNVAFGFNFVYLEDFSNNKDSAKFIKTNFLKAGIFENKVKGAGVKLLFENDGIQYNFNIDPTSFDSSSIRIQVNANHNGSLPNKTTLKKNFTQDLTFVKKIIDQAEFNE